MASILVADDDKFIRDYLRNVLIEEEYNVQTVESGSAAIKKILKQNFDVLILDIHMSGINGLETISFIKSVHPNLPIIVITGDASMQTEKRAREEGVFCYFTKPLNIKGLKQVITSALKTRAEK
ncbi:response regulator [Candidatus Aerophobetes bacterium]|nr:response regulator [Candidatus Aerophobetes bacterium]